MSALPPYMSNVHRYPNLDSYPIFFHGIPVNRFDCFYAIDPIKSKYTGQAEWDIAFFSGHKLRNGYRQVTFNDRPETLHIIHTQDILSWYDFCAEVERDKQRQQLERERATQIAKERKQKLQQECNDFFDQVAESIERKYIIFIAEHEFQNFEDTIEQQRTAVDEQIIEQNATVRSDVFAPENRQCDPVLAPVRATVQGTSTVLLPGEGQCDPLLAPVYTTVEGTSAVLLDGSGGISSITALSFNISSPTTGLLQVPAAGGILVQQPTPQYVEPISEYTNCSEIPIIDDQLRTEFRQAKIACEQRLLQQDRVSKSATATQVHQAGGISTSILHDVGVTSTVNLCTGPYGGIRAAHLLRIDLGEPPTTAGKSAAILLAGSVCAGVDSFSTAGINAALPSRTGIGVHPPTVGLSTAKSMAGSASAGDSDVVYDFAADNPDNPIAFNAVYNASRG